MTKEDDEITTLEVLGRDLGTFVGYDQISDNTYIFYGFKPVSYLHVDIPTCDLIVDYLKGWFSCESLDSEEILKTMDMLELLAKVPRNAADKAN